MLGRNEGQFYRLRASEKEPLKECLQWLREQNPHLQIFWSNAERFGNLYEKLQSVLPRGSTEAPIRMHRTRQLESAVGSTLDATLGQEAAVLVVGDRFF